MADKKKRKRQPSSPLFTLTAEDRKYSALIEKNGTQSVCFFNNKGGVGKTTLVANLASFLAFNWDMKILVVDADPQCNLTQYALNDDEFIDLYAASDIDSIHSIIHPLSIGKGYRQDLPIRHMPNFGFDIIVGDPRLALKEDLLAQDWRDAKSGGTRGLRTTFMFYDLIEKAKKYDFVFFDMGPSLGAINRSILLAVDHFVVPMSIDIFSLWAIKNIGSAVKIWQRELFTGLNLAEDPAEVPKTYRKRLNFVGYVTQQHKERTEGGNVRVVEAYEAIRKRLPAEVSSSLEGLYQKELINPHLGDVKHLGSLAPKSQMLHTPMTNVALTGSYTLLRKRAREIYGEISNNFIKNIALSKAGRSRSDG